MSQPAPPAEARVLLIEPDAGGRVSGGYLYNQRIADAAPEIQRRSVRLETISQDVAQLDVEGAGVLLIDSLFFAPALLPEFLALRARTSASLGVLMHAFPSFIARAQDRDALARALPLALTPEDFALLAKLDVLVALGPYVPRVVRGAGSSIPCLVCPPGVELVVAPRSHALAATEPAALISIGAVTRLKGLSDAARALSAVRSASWHWTIAGSLDVEPDYTAQLRRELGDLGIESRVRFAGQLEPAAALSALSRSDVLLITSFTETYSLVAAEALAARVPVAGYAVGGVPDVIEHGETGLLAPLLDVAALSGCIETLVTDAGERRRLADGCVRAAERLPSWPRAGEMFLERLSALARGSTRP